MTDIREKEQLMSYEAEVQRIDRTGTIWFASALGAVALVIAGIVLSGWRPTDLVGAGPDVWWIGFTFTFIGLAAIGYAGCPIYWGNTRVAHAQKSIAIRGGLVFFLLGSAISVIALLVG